MKALIAKSMARKTLVSFLFCVLSTSYSYAQELVILNWSDYMAPDLIIKFEEMHKVKIREVYFNSDFDRDAMLLQSNGSVYDVVLASGNKMAIYKRNSWLEPLSEKQIPSLNNIAKKWRTAYQNADGYGVPYFWGSVGIGYRKDLVKEEITSWRQLFEPKKELHKRISMIEDGRDLIGVALKALGYSLNTSNIKEIEQAEKLLKRQKPYVQQYSYPATTEKSALITGELSMSMMYNGDAVVLQDYNENIAFVLPEEGGSLWVDYLVVLKQSKNKKLAMKFINFLNEPKNAAVQAKYARFATPNLAAEKYLSNEFLTNPIIYPERKTLDKSEFVRKVPPRVLKKINKITNDLIK